MADETPNGLEAAAQTVLNGAYQTFKTAQLKNSKAEIFDSADYINLVTIIRDTTLLYLFDETISQRIIDLDDTVLAVMYDAAIHADFVKTNFTGNDIRALLGLPRERHHRKK